MTGMQRFGLMLMINSTPIAIFGIWSDDFWIALTGLVFSILGSILLVFTGDD